MRSRVVTARTVGICDYLNLDGTLSQGILVSLHINHYILCLFCFKGGRPLKYHWRWNPEDVKSTCQIDPSVQVLTISPKCLIQNPANQTSKMFNFTLTVSRDLKANSHTTWIAINRTRMCFCEPAKVSKTLHFFVFVVSAIPKDGVSHQKNFWN